jgi:mRNA-degrading endonuclease RelE of RelBE toxin-antitoxin system
MINFRNVPEFESDLKALSKRYSSLSGDIERLKSALKTTTPKFLPGAFRISDLGEDVSDPVYKVKHFRCESLKGKGCRSGIRIIFSHDETTNEVQFIQIYCKSQTDNEDKIRIKKYCESCQLSD